MAWQPELETGYAQIDAEHRALVEAVNRLHQALDRGEGRKEVGRMLDFLRSYVVTHFTAEETAMFQTGYPEAAAHCASHADLLLELSNRVADLRSGREAGELLAFLEAWLVDHILREDQAFGSWARLHGRAV